MAMARDFGLVGRLCLDLTVTGDIGYGTRFERLTSPAEFRRWLSMDQLRLPKVRVTAADVERAKELRRAIWRAVLAVLEGSALAAVDVRLINRTACHPGLVRELEATGQSMRWHCPNASAALASIAQDAVVLLGDPAQRARIRRCQNPGCRVVFYDDSRPGLRRWCAPNRCGDRTRAKLYRDRRRTENAARNAEASPRPVKPRR